MAGEGEQKLLATSPSASAGFGLAVAAVDLDADGDDELVVGTWEEGVWVYPGQAGGVVEGSETGLTTEGAGWFGVTLAPAGDVDGDGFDDLIVGDTMGGSWLTGAAYVYRGSTAGLDSATEVALAPADGDLWDAFGVSASGGDSDGDGYDDVVVGASGHDDAASEAGAVYLHLGSASGTSSSALEILAGDAAASDGFGIAVALDGDLDGDGLDDLVVGAYQHGTTGAVYVYPGSGSGPDTAAELQISASDGAADDDFGAAVAHAGDLDGDGYGDVVVGAPGADATALDAGALYAYPGSAAGVDGGGEVKLLAAGGGEGDELGATVAGGHDLDEDGHADLVAGSPYASSWTGALSVWYGAASGLSEDEERITASGSTQVLGYSVAFGDLDGDGHLEVVGSAPWDSESAASAGAVFVWRGGDVDRDGWAEPDDCDDGDGSVSPDAAEACNGIDDDCDGETDESGATWGRDADGDGYGDATATLDACAAPEGYVADTTDCDDADAATHPGAPEADCADPVDRDCDGAPGDADPDGDGVASCLDCAPDDPAIHPGASEVCDAEATDEDCDGLADDADPGVTGAPTWFADADGDGHGDAAAPLAACELPSGHVAEGDDCDDADAARNPEATEVCDEADADEDCDGKAEDADDPDPASRFTWYADVDGDGFPAAVSVACDARGDVLSAAEVDLDLLDCDDGHAAVHPGAQEACDDQDADDDCDGAVDDADPDVVGQRVWRRDADGDGYGGDERLTQCDRPEGYVFAEGDCDDGAAGVHPHAPEDCDGVDEDCDGTVDDDPSDPARWWRDDDGDGWGDPDQEVEACSRPSGYVAATGLDDWEHDCDDTNAAVHPYPLSQYALDELPSECDGVDWNCDGVATTWSCPELVDDRVEACCCGSSSGAALLLFAGTVRWGRRRTSGRAAPPRAPARAPAAGG